MILLQFRNGHATDLQTLCQALGLRPGANPAEYYLENIVRKFIEAGLLQADDPEDLGHTKIGVTEQLSRFQTALDISLTFLASFNRSRSMAVEPLFGLPNKLEELDVFVLMPFKDDMLPVYEDHIKPTCANMELSIRRADDFFTAGSVVQDVWAAIASARVIVAAPIATRTSFTRSVLLMPSDSQRFYSHSVQRMFHSTCDTCATSRINLRRAE